MKMQIVNRSMRRINRRALPLIPVLLWPWLTLDQLPAATFTWDGSSSGYWGTGANWDTGTVPQDGDNLVFPAGPTRLATTNNTSSSHRFRSITISGANYALRGNSLTLSNGITATHGAGASASVELDITLARSQEIECTTDNSILYMTGDLNLGAFTLTVNGSGNVLFGGVISGTGGVTKTGTGSARLYGASANSYTGITRVNDGILEFNKTSGVNAMGGDLVVGNDTGDPETAKWLNNAQLPSTTDVTVNQGALLDLNNHNEALGELTLNAGKVETGSGTLTLGGDVTAGGVDGIASIRGNLSLGIANRTFEILPDPDGSYPQMYIYATISGSGGIHKTGSGALSLAGTNTYSGPTFVGGGALVVDASAALGGTTSGTTVEMGGELHLRGNAQVGNESLTLTSFGPAGPGNFSFACYGGTSNSWAGPITLVNEVGISINRDTVLELSGPIGGAGGFTTIGLGTLVLSGSEANTFAGDVQVDSGSLHLNKTITDGALPGPGALIIGDDAGGSLADVVRLQHNAQIDGSVAITINTSGTFHLDNFSETIGELTLNSGYVSSLTGTLILGGNVFASATPTNVSVINANLSLGSSTRTLDVAFGGASTQLRLIKAVSGSGGIRKTGLGRLELRGANTYGGLTTVAEGTLTVGNNTALGATAQGTVVEDGATVYLILDTRVADEPLTLRGYGPFSYYGALAAFGTNSWTGPLAFAADTGMYVATNCSLNLAGPISGSGGFTKTGGGTVSCSGSSGNTYAGNTVVEEGTLELAKTAGTAAVRYGTLFIGDGVGGANADVVRFVADNQLWSVVSIVITNSGWLDLNGHEDVVGPLTFSAGRASSGASGLLRLGGDVTVNASVSGCPSIEGNVDLYAHRMFAIANSSCSPDLNLRAAVSGSAGFTKTGAGALGLYASNRFDGAVTINQSLVYLYDDDALGSTAGGTVVNDGGVLVLANGRAIGIEPLTLNGSGDDISGALASIGGSNSWAGTVTLATDAVLTVQTNRHLNLTGVVAGPGGFIKNQPGTMILSGSTANTFAGHTIVNEGILLLDKTGLEEALSGPGELVIGDGAGGVNADVVRELRNSQIGSAVPIKVSASGLLDLANHYDVVGTLVFNGGRATTGSGGLLYLGSTVIATNGSGTIEGTVQMNATCTFNTAEAAGANVYVEAQVQGPGGLFKTGPGQLFLSHSNNYGGVTTIAQGLLYADHDFALGTTNGGTSVSDGAGLVLRYDTHVGNEPLTLNGNGQSTLGALASIYGSNSWAGPITLASATRLTTLQASDYLHLSGAIGGSGDLTLEGPGTVIFSGSNPNTYAGTTRVSEGMLLLAKTPGQSAISSWTLTIGNSHEGAPSATVRLAADDQLSNFIFVSIYNSGVLDLDSHNETVEYLSGWGETRLGLGHLTVNNGSVTGYGGVISGTGRLTKAGPGRMYLRGPNTYTGPTTVIDGALLINGSQPQSPILVDNSSTLLGTGTAGDVTNSGYLMPGDYDSSTRQTLPGILATSNLTASGVFQIELNGPTAGAGYDQVDVRGTVNLSSCELRASLGFLPAEGGQFIVIDNDGTDPVLGIFSGLTNGAVFAVNGVSFRISYNGGSGNDVVLTATDTAALRPALSVSHTRTNTVIVSWPAPAEGWRLHTTTNLVTGGSVWTEIPPPYPTNATDCVVTEPTAVGNKFYRLRKP